MPGVKELKVYLVASFSPNGAKDLEIILIQFISYTNNNLGTESLLTVETEGV